MLEKKTISFDNLVSNNPTQKFNSNLKKHLFLKIITGIAILSFSLGAMFFFLTPNQNDTILEGSKTTISIENKPFSFVYSPELTTYHYEINGHSILLNIINKSEDSVKFNALKTDKLTIIHTSLSQDFLSKFKPMEKYLSDPTYENLKYLDTELNNQSYFSIINSSHE